jgi:hypothetical protein
MANTATEKKITKRDFFSAIRNFIEGEDTIDGIDVDKVIKFIDNELTLLDKKKTSSKVTAKQEENAKYKELILDVLAEIGEPATIKTIYENSPELAEGLNNSNQRISSLLTQLKNDNLVIRSEVKGVAHFTVSPEEVDG